MSVEQVPQNKTESQIERRSEVVRAVEVAEVMTLTQRIRYILNDPDCRETVDASTRTLLNGLITLADGVPAAGDILESAVYASKISLPWLRSIVGVISKRAAKWLKSADLTPDISAAKSTLIGAATLPAEAVSFGAFPSYGIQALFQLKADLQNNRFKSGSRVLNILMTGRDLQPSTDQKKMLDEASKEFK